MRGAAVALLALACARAPAASTMSPLEARYRLAARGAGATTATRIYRSALAPAMFSRCRMVPSDSRLFDLRAGRCGELRSVYLGAARLLLEASASPRTLRPVVWEGQVRFFDLPDACAP